MNTLLVSATRWEILPLIIFNPFSSMGEGPPIPSFPRKGGRGIGDLRIGIVGMGAQRAAGRLEKLLAAQRPDRVIVAGFSGAVQKEQRTGDVAIPSLFSCADGGVGDVQREEDFAQTPLREVLSFRGLRLLNENRQLSVQRIAGPQRKRQLGSRWSDSCGVDMESHALAQVCLRHTIPMMCVRVILDELEENLCSVWGLWHYPTWYLKALRNLSLAVRRVLDTVDGR